MSMEIIVDKIYDNIKAIQDVLLLSYCDNWINKLSFALKLPRMVAAIVLNLVISSKTFDTSNVMQSLIYALSNLRMHALLRLIIIVQLAFLIELPKNQFHNL